MKISPKIYDNVEPIGDRTTDIRVLNIIGVYSHVTLHLKHTDLTRNLFRLSHLPMGVASVC